VRAGKAAWLAFGWVAKALIPGSAARTVSLAFRDGSTMEDVRAADPMLQLLEDGGVFHADGVHHSAVEWETPLVVAAAYGLDVAAVVNATRIGMPWCRGRLAARDKLKLGTLVALPVAVGAAPQRWNTTAAATRQGVDIQELENLCGRARHNPKASHMKGEMKRIWTLLSTEGWSAINAGSGKQKQTSYHLPPGHAGPLSLPSVASVCTHLLQTLRRPLRAAGGTKAEQQQLRVRKRAFDGASGPLPKRAAAQAERKFSTLSINAPAALEPGSLCKVETPNGAPHCPGLTGAVKHS
jgi:hypothetical protein